MTLLFIAPMFTGTALMQIHATQKGTAVCSDLPTFSLLDYQKGPQYHTKHGLDLNGANVYIVGMYYAD